MRVHIPLTGFSLSGGMRTIIEVAGGLVRRGHEVRITVPFYNSEPTFPLGKGVERVVVGDSTLTKSRYAVRVIREAAGWGDVLVATNYKTPHLLRRSIRRNRSRAHLVYFVLAYEPYTQGTLYEGPWWRRFLNRRLALKSYSLADTRFYVARKLAEDVGLDTDPILVHPGVDPEVFFPSTEKTSPRKMRVGVIARPGRLKGFHLFKEAMKQLSSFDFETVIHRPESGRETADFYREIDIFVFPSLYEGWPLPPLEAMASGAAVVTSAAGGVTEYARDEENSLVVPTNDAGALALAVRRLLESSDLRQRLIRNGRRTAAEYTWEKTTDQFCRGLDRIL